jgi:type IV pilus secretin PilQ/predicted competence protein
LKRPAIVILWIVVLGLGLIAGTRADGPPAGSSAPKAATPTPRKAADTPRGDGVVRASQDVPLPPSPGVLAPTPGSATSPPIPLEPLIDDPASPRRPGDASGTISMHYDNRDIRQVLEIFSRSEKLNLLISPSVTGSITVNLDGVTPQQALEAIMSLGNLEAYRTGGLTYIYTVEEFKALNLGKRRAATKVYRLQYIRADEIVVMLKPFLSTDGKAIATPETDEGIDENANFAAGLPTVSASAGGGGGGSGAGGRGSTGGNQIAGGDMIIVQDYPENLMIVDDMIAKLDVMPVQVLIEAIIIRVDLTKTQMLGVNLGAVNMLDTVLALSGNGSALSNTIGFTPLKILSAPTGNILNNAGNALGGSSNGGLSFGFIGGNVSGFVQALETIAKTNVLATPRVLVLNKQRAEIQLGQRLGYRTLVTNLTSTVQQIQFINTGTLLRLRPFISDDGMIRMEIHPERSTGLIDANGVPQVNTARMTTNVMVPNGATLVIGGLIDNQDDSSQNGVPVLNRLPVVGALFRTRNQDVIKSEVVILLTPRLWNPADPEGTNCLPTTKTAMDTSVRTSQKIELGSDRPFRDGLLGGRLYYDTPGRAERLEATDPGKNPYTHTVKSGENFWTISRLYYKSGRYYMALWNANKKCIAAPDRLTVGDRIIIPRADQLDPSLILESPAPARAILPGPVPILEPANLAPMPPPPLDGMPGPFGQKGTKDPAAKVASGTKTTPPSPKPAAGTSGK